MYLMLAFVMFISFSIQGSIFALCSERLIHRVRNQAFRTMLRQDIEFFDLDENSAGALTSFLSTETTHVAGLSGATLGTLLIEPGYDRDALEACDAGLTECESLVAQTGSACVTALSSGGRTLSVLPPHHLIVAREEQLVADLSAAYERLALKYEGRYPSFIGFVTGPSRTGDIERILVLGAHGPKRLTILLIP